MGTKIYHKLVRDRIPDIIKADSKTCVTEILPDKQYLEMLDAKLSEELAEYQESKSLEELADLLEVIQAVVNARGWTWEQLEQVRADKAAERGAFHKKLLLKKVIGPAAPKTLVDAICEHQAVILAKIDMKMLSMYGWLIDNLHTRNVSADKEYRKKFTGYYRMRFVSHRYRDAFFALFEQLKSAPKISFEEVSAQLYQVDSKHEFSFITKMLHTIDPTGPIYDSQVDAALNIHRTYQKNFEKRIQQDMKILDDISACYRQLKEAPQLSEILAVFDEIAPSCKISIEKKLDFILWALGAH